MKRCAKILCTFGSIELLAAAVLGWIFMQIPYPWGGRATVIIEMHGLHDAPVNFDRTSRYLAYTGGSITGLGLCGAAFLLVGGLMALVSLLKAIYSARKDFTG